MGAGTEGRGEGEEGERRDEREGEEDGSYGRVLNGGEGRGDMVMPSTVV